MRKANVSILASVIAITLVAVAAGAGTMAYFTENTEAGVTFTSGDPDLKIWDGSDWQESLTLTPPMWAPGDTWDVDIYVKNVGDMGLWALYVSGDNLGGTAGFINDLANAIHITDVAYEDTCGMVHPAGGTYYDGFFGDDLNPLTLKELAEGVDEGDHMAFCWGDCETEGDYLPPGVQRHFYIEFTFDSAAGNSLQGKIVTFDLVFLGSDDPFTPVWVPP